MIESLIHVGSEPSSSLDSRPILKSSFSPKAPKPILDIALELLSSYDEALFVGEPLSLKIILKCLNPSQIDGNIQNITIKARRFFHCLLHLGYFLCKVPYLILKLNMAIYSMAK